jgi:hypothetical protein
VSAAIFSPAIRLIHQLQEQEAIAYGCAVEYWKTRGTSSLYSRFISLISAFGGYFFGSNSADISEIVNEVQSEQLRPQASDETGMSGNIEVCTIG